MLRVHGVEGQEATSDKPQCEIERWIYEERCFEQKEQNVQKHRSLKKWKLTMIFSMIRA